MGNRHPHSNLPSVLSNPIIHWNHNRIRTDDTIQLFKHRVRDKGIADNSIAVAIPSIRSNPREKSSNSSETLLKSVSTFSFSRRKGWPFLNRLSENTYIIKTFSFIVQCSLKSVSIDYFVILTELCLALWFSYRYCVKQFLNLLLLIFLYLDFLKGWMYVWQYVTILVFTANMLIDDIWWQGASIHGQPLKFINDLAKLGLAT